LDTRSNELRQEAGNPANAAEKGELTSLANELANYAKADRAMAESRRKLSADLTASSKQAGEASTAHSQNAAKLNALIAKMK
jgi:hypothetical protein